MREKLNNNPLVQVAVFGVLALLVGVFLLSKGGGEEEVESGTTEATVAVAGTDETGTAIGASPGEAVEGAIEAVGGEAAVGASVTVSAVVPADAPPLPKSVVDAFKANHTVVLLFVDNGGIDDRLVTDSVERLSSLSDVSTFVVPVGQIARYTTVTQGVAVDRVPALVVVRPRKLSDTPQASVSYGFQSPESVEQAVIDAGYEGPTLDYHP